MSHFSVIVIGDDVDAQLQPYHEYECTGTEDEYVQDMDVTGDRQDEWVKVDNKHEYDHSFSRWLKYWHHETVNAEGRVINRTNPNAKWDWWVIGGLWSNWLGIASGKKADFDFDGIRGKAGETAGLNHKLFAPPADMPRPKPWAEYREDFETIEDAREAWRSEPCVTHVKKAAEKHGTFIRSPDEFFGGHDEYVASRRRSILTPFAYVIDGEWKSKGDMGWPGMSKDEFSQADWDNHFSNVLEALPDDTTLTVVDCHI